LCLALLLLSAAAVCHAAVDEAAAVAAGVNDVHHDFQEDVHLTEDESKIIDLDDEEESSGDYLDDAEDEDYDDDYYDDEDDEDWASGDYDDDDDDDYLEEEDEDDEDEDITFDDDKDDLLYEYHAEDYEGDDYDFTKEVEDNVVYQPPQVQIRDSGKSEKDETVTVAEPSTPRNLLISVFVASGLASFALFTLAFVMCFCNRRSRDPASAKQSQLPFVIHHGSLPLNSSIIKPGKYQPVATQENKTNHSIENANSVLKQTQLEEKLLP